jgi:AraC-like DNA-binding protein
MVRRRIRGCMNAKAVEQVKFWCDPDLQNVELLRATYITHAFSRHSHDGYAIGVIESGVEAFAYRGAMHYAPAGSIAVVHPGEVHTGHAGVPEGWSYRMLYPPVAFVQAAIAEDVADFCSTQELSWVPYFDNPVIHDPELACALSHLHQTLEQGLTTLARESKMLWAFNQLIRRHADWRPLALPDTLESAAIALAREYLDTHYAHNVSLDQLATVAQLKPLRLLRSFQKVTGLPPHRYLIQTRVMQAKTLLAQGRAIADVAVETGFTDQSHLNRHFKRLVGVTPGQYLAGYS